MTQLVCCTSISGVGCTFMDWSIHFLSGKNKFFALRANTWIDLVQNPLDKTNAHTHKKNHPSGLHNTKFIIERLKGQHELVSYYPFPIHEEAAAAAIGINGIPTTADQWKRIRNYQEDDYNQLLKFSASKQAKIIFISIDKSMVLYTRFLRTLEKLFYVPNQPATSIEEMRNQLDSVFFKDSVYIWNKLGLTDVWDVRERLALCTRPLEWDSINVDLSFDHYWLDSQNWWYNGKKKIQDIMAWLDLDIDPVRFEQWIPIYEQWQQIQLRVLEFQFNYKHIIDCIVNDWSYDIDLTFEQEIIIQHCLIYQHGLNLKTWQLEKFPKNTRDLHQLLEPNIHKI